MDPFFYKSWWFILIMFLVFIYIARQFYVWKMNSYRRQKEILENTVKDFYISNAGNSITVVGAALNKFSVFNVQGKLVSASSNVVGNTIDFSSLNDGVYIVKIETANGSLVKKIIKK